MVFIVFFDVLTFWHNDTIF